MKKIGSVIHLGKYSLIFMGEEEYQIEEEIIKEYYFQLESYNSKKITITSKNEILVEKSLSIGSNFMMYSRYDDFNTLNREFFITLLIVKDQILEITPDIKKYNLLFDRLEQNSILKRAIERNDKYNIKETQRILSNINFELSLYENEDLKYAWNLVNTIAPGYKEVEIG